MEATADSDFGPAKAVVTLVDRNDALAGNVSAINDNGTPNDPSDDPLQGDTSTFDAAEIDEAYVSIGDQTVIMAGKKGSVHKDGDDETFTALFDLDGVDNVDDGIEHQGVDTGGHVIQITSDLG